MRSRSTSRILIALVGVCTLVSSCTSSGQGATTSANSTTLTPVLSGATSATAVSTGTVAGTAGPGSAAPATSAGVGATDVQPGILYPSVLFASTDGSAFVGSRPVFTLTDAATGQTYTTPVNGSGSTTQTQIYVKPGTYAVTAADRYLSGTGSYAVRSVDPAQITVASVADGPAATVNFSLDVQRSPFDLSVHSMTTNQVELGWQALAGAQPSNYQLRQTSGSTPASGPTDGAAIPLKDADATSGLATDLAADTKYTFTLFASGADGAGLAFRSVSVTTPKDDGSTPSFALAPNTIVPSNFAALQAKPLGDDKVAVTIDAGNGGRSSVTAIPGVDTGTLTSGCAPGMPFLVSSDVAGSNSFYGLVESCIAPPPSLRALPGATTAAPISAVIDTKVPLAAVVPYLSFRNSQYHACIDTSGTELGANAPLCAGKDSDGDGMKDTMETALGRNPSNKSDGLQTFLDEGKPQAKTPTPAITTLQPPAGLGTGDVQVTLLWTTGDDLDLAVTDPAGARISYDTQTVPSGGTLDHDDRGDPSCPKSATQTRAENIVWKGKAPNGNYSALVTNYLGGGDDARTACGKSVQAKLQIRIGGTLREERTITAGADGPVPFIVSDSDPLGRAAPVADLQLPADLRTGALQVSVLWSSNDDLSMWVTEPQGKRVGPDGRNTTTDAAYTHNDSGGICAEAPKPRADTVTWPTTVPPGAFSMYAVRQSAPCLGAAGTTAWIEVRLRGAVVLRELTYIPKDANGPTIKFTVPLALPGLRGSAGALVSASSASMPKKPALASGMVRPTKPPKIECGGAGAATFETHFGFDEFHNVEEFTLDGASLKWNIRAGISVSADPTLTLEAGVKCSLVMDGLSFQLTETPVPINLTLDPVLEGSATGKYELKGPKLDLTFGIKTSGDVDATVDTCGWFDAFPCGVGVKAHASASPIGSFTSGSASLSAVGTLSLGLGVVAYIGIGYDNDLVTAKAGFSFTMKPIVETAEASTTATVGATSTTTSTAPPRTTAPTTSAPTVVLDNPPYNRQKLSLILSKQIADKHIVVNGTQGKLPLVGPTTDNSCWDGAPPVPTTAVAGGSSVYRCHDAYCLSTHYPILTDWQYCPRALCVVTKKVVNGGKADDGIAECPQAKIESPPIELDLPDSPTTTARGAVTTKTSTTPLGFSQCAKVKMGAELSANFEADAFVLDWGASKKFLLWNGDFDYPNENFQIGNCN